MKTILNTLHRGVLASAQSLTFVAFGALFMVGCAPTETPQDAGAVCEGTAGCACTSHADCDAPLGCTTDGVCGTSETGTEGGRCDADGACERGLKCDVDAMTCVADVCQPGTEGCPCVNDVCGVNARGETLSCMNDVCVADSCVPGDQGCACAGGETCTNADDVCEGGFCVAGTCAPGTENCACGPGGACAGGLTCRDGAVCVDNAGYLGGACLPGDVCNGQAACSAGVCVPCTPGTDGCVCTAQDGCLTGSTCSEGRCVNDDVLGPRPPADPVCYTPCSAGFQETNAANCDGAESCYRACMADGLMRGCVGDYTCQNGSCVKPGETAPACERDVDCPEHQACLRGMCASNCESDAQCGSGEQCFRRVCRTTCTAEEDACGEGYACVLQDSEQGVCMQLAEPSPPVETLDESTFTVDRTDLKFSNTAPARRITITNDSARSRVFLVRKLEERARDADGNTTDILDLDDDDACDVARGECPLTWLMMGEAEDEVAAVQSLSIPIDAGATATVFLTEAGASTAVSWRGKLEIVEDELGKRFINMEYTQRPDGRWAGSAYYFATFGDDNLADWQAAAATSDGAGPSKNDVPLQLAIGNAFVQRWAAFRRGAISFEEFSAVMQATEVGSWNWASTKNACGAEGGACYLYDEAPGGIGVYSSDTDSRPVPTGLIELPVALNLKTDDSVDGLFTGRIQSSDTLHYAGNAAVQIAFTQATDACDITAYGSCLLYMDTFESDVWLGGRYDTDEGNCDQRGPGLGFEPTRTPWLLPGFERMTTVDEETNTRYRTTCRDATLPLVAGPTDDAAEIAAQNRALTAATPIPNGLPIRRELRLVDGALINQSKMIVIFEEKFSSFLGDDAPPMSGYGYMVLERTDADLTADDNMNGEPDAYEGNTVTDGRTMLSAMGSTTCSEDMLDLFTNGQAPSQANAPALIRGLINGTPGASPPAAIGSSERAHVFCADTGAFNDGYDQATPCPAESEVVYFTLASNYSDGTLRNQTCMREGVSCRETLNGWKTQMEAGRGPMRQYQPAYTCADGAYCDANRLNLREGKTFYQAVPANSPRLLLTLRAAMSSAFRYKIRFQSRSGENVGFAPEQCVPGSDAVPYCYDAAEIEELRERMDCLLSVWDAFGPALRDEGQGTDAEADEARAAANLMVNTLEFSFSNETECLVEGCTTFKVHDGFERLYAELLVMMGDESYTQAFASRFDLAGASSVSFEGSAFEPNGIDLSGIAGFEMYRLYQSTQYYQESLDRFYALAPEIWLSLTEEARVAALPEEQRYTAHDNFVSPETVTAYIERLVRASTQKARAFSEIAERYQSFNRPDLARAVMERAYTATYLESVVLSQIMLRITERIAPESRPQVRKVLDEIQIRARMAMLDMRKVYASITDEVTLLGFAPDYVPMPALEQQHQHAFAVISDRARSKLALAKRREETALSQNRSYEVDSAQFQSELTRIRQNYENQLGDMCGTFEADGRVYPAISKYAELDSRAAAIGDPCGWMGNGRLHQAMGQIDIIATDLQRLQVQAQNIQTRIQIEETRAQEQCDLIDDIADYEYEAAGEIKTMNAVIGGLQAAGAAADRALSSASTLAQLGKCLVLVGTANGSDCPAAAISASAYASATLANNIAQAGISAGVIAAQQNVEEIQRSTGRWRTRQQCSQLQIDSEARVQEIGLDAASLELEILRAVYRMRLAYSEVSQLRNTAKRLELEQQEVSQLTINVEAARNDPNVRLYRNDAIINADISFNDALREALRATRVYEYYTSTSYADKEKLYLIRMVTAGDYNLENYMVELENAFYTFGETYGIPDQRVMVLSLRDDVLGIPYTTGEGATLSQSERIEQMRAALRDPANLDRNGYLSLPFSTRLDVVSPLTRNHKVRFVEAEMIGASTGDTLGRLYLRQRGTSAVHSLEGDRLYYRFAPRVAVLNPFFNGNRFFTQEVYRSYRMRDLPLINSGWDLVINQRDEDANRDIDLQSLSDVRLYVHYTDFTALE